MVVVVVVVVVGGVHNPDGSRDETTKRGEERERERKALLID